MKSAKVKPSERCESCREQLVPTLVSVYRHRRGRHILFQNVHALVCRSCGQRIYEPDAVEMMEHALLSRTTRKRQAQLTIVAAS